MTGPDRDLPAVPDGAGADPAGPLDLVDELVLERIAAVHTLLDPPPVDLDDRVQFVLALEDLDVEVARLAAVPAGSGVRAADLTRTITFDTTSCTIMITIAEQSDGLVQIDGWLAPPAAATVELRRSGPEPPARVTADPSGRFVFTGIPHGLVQLLVHPPAGEPGSRVVTPAVAL